MVALVDLDDDERGDESSQADSLQGVVDSSAQELLLRCCGWL
jgi:hypothetical protein